MNSLNGYHSNGRNGGKKKPLNIRQVKNRILTPIDYTLIAGTLLTLKLAIALIGDLVSSDGYGVQAVYEGIWKGGPSIVMLAVPIAIVVALLIGFVGLNYIQVISTNDRPGGAYVLAIRYLGSWIARIGGSGLCLDYLLTIAVSIAAMVEAFRALFPGLDAYPITIPYIHVVLSFQLWCTEVITCLMMVIQWWGPRKTGWIFAFIVYWFMASIGIMLIWAGTLALFHHLPVIADGTYKSAITQVEGSVPWWLAFIVGIAGGVAGATGTESMANNVGNLVAPQKKNAIIITVIAILFMGATFPGLALVFWGVHAVAGVDNPIMIAQASSILFQGWLSPLDWSVKLSTSSVLGVAALAAFLGGPKVVALMAHDRQVPEKLSSYGNKYTHEVSIAIFGLSAMVLEAIFGASSSRMLALYAMGVFVAFVETQFGMAIKLIREKQNPFRWLPWQISVVLSIIGGFVCLGVLGFIIYSKWSDGGWIGVLLMVVSPFIMSRIQYHYDMEDAHTRLRVDEIVAKINYFVHYELELTVRAKGDIQVVTIGDFDDPSLDMVYAALKTREQVICVYINTDKRYMPDPKTGIEYYTPIELQWQQAFGGIPQLQLNVVHCRNRQLLDCMINWVDLLIDKNTRDGIQLHDIYVNVAKKVLTTKLVSSAFHRNIADKLVTAFHLELGVRVTTYGYSIPNSPGSFFDFSKWNPMRRIHQEIESDPIEKPKNPSRHEQLLAEIKSQEM